jgi:hypothetical protein
LHYLLRIEFGGNGRAHPLQRVRDPLLVVRRAGEQCQRRLVGGDVEKQPVDVGGKTLAAGDGHNQAMLRADADRRDDLAGGSWTEIEVARHHIRLVEPACNGRLDPGALVIGGGPWGP